MSFQHCIRGTKRKRAIKKEMKTGRKWGKKGRKEKANCIFVTYTENPKKSKKKKNLALIHEINKVTGYHVNIQQSSVFLHTGSYQWNIQSKNNIWSCTEHKIYKVKFHKNICKAFILTTVWYCWEKWNKI